jgi:hypothetical protein
MVKCPAGTTTISEQALQSWKVGGRFAGAAEAAAIITIAPINAVDSDFMPVNLPQRSSFKRPRWLKHQ